MQAIGDNIIFNIIGTIKAHKVHWIKAEILSIGGTLAEKREINKGDIVYINDDGYDLLPDGSYTTSSYYIVAKE